MNKQITNYKDQIKLKLIRSLPTNLKEIEPDIVRNIIRKITESIVKNKLDFNEKEELFESISSEILGHGPIDSLLKDPLITEIMINGCNQIYAEKKGKLSLTAINFYNNDQLLSFVDKILSSAGRRVTELEPFVDARLSDGSRINVVRPPISVIPIVTIRKFNFHTLNIQELIQLNTLNSQISSFLAACVKEQINIIISGGTGSGKTTLLNTLGCFIPKDERVVIVENTRELHLEHPHVVSLECRPPSIDGKGEITLRQLVKNSLHMRPNRIILGEVRGEEALDVIQAMNTGQQGSLCTIHSNSCIDSLERLQVLTLLGNSNISSEVAMKQTILAIDLIVQMARLKNGERKIMEVAEVTKNNASIFTLRRIFVREGEKIIYTGTPPSFYNKLKLDGYTNPLFENNKK